MERFSNWLAGTQASAVIQNVPWVIPAVQCVHILAISVVMASVLLLNLRLVGIIGGGEAADAFTRRYLPWVYSALAVLLVSGSILIVGEPNRDLGDWVFWTKMALVLTVLILTTLLEVPLLKNARFWEPSGRKLLSRLLAVVAMACWIAIVFCGRWIAYTYMS